MGPYESAGYVHQKQRQLDREGCQFLIVVASSDNDVDRAKGTPMQVLIRFVVRCGRQAVKDVIAHIPKATADRESAREGWVTSPFTEVRGCRVKRMPAKTWTVHGSAHSKTASYTVMPSQLRHNAEGDQIQL